MRLVEMEEVKERLPNVSGDPSLRNLFGLAAVALHATDVRAAVRRVDLIVILVEAAGDSGFTAEHECRNRRRRGITVLLQQLRQRRHRGPQTKSEVVADAILRRQRTSEDRRMGRQGQRNVRIGALEQNCVGAQRIDVRSIDVPVSVNGKMIRSQSIDRNEDDRGSIGSADAAAIACHDCKSEEQK